MTTELAAFLYLAGAAWFQTRDIRRNWIRFGESETTLSIKGNLMTLSNDSVRHASWTWNTGLESGTRLDLWAGPDQHDVDLFLSRRQRRRALERGNETFRRAVWEFDNMAGLVPGSHWGPDEPVPDLRTRARWRDRDRGRSIREAWAARGPGRHRLEP